MNLRKVLLDVRVGVVQQIDTAVDVGKVTDTEAVARVEL